ncbi:hypothetical protein ES705_09940 [subsurface metagenome]
MEKKTLALGLIAIIAVGFGITGVVLFFIEEPEEGEGALPTTLIFGTMYIVVDLDPQGSWDSASMDVIDQVCEGLLAYDFFDPNLEIVPKLATGMGTFNPAGTEYTILLRDDVTFHDGTHFNATAVKFTWDRMAWALNTTGTNMIDKTIVEELYVFPEDQVPIVNDTIINSEYSVTFVLNRPYIAFEALLCFEASYILSPTSTPADRYLETATDDLVGTGPYVYDSTEAAVEVLLHAYDNYYGEKAKIQNLVFAEITDANARNIALLAGDVNYVDDPMWEYWPIFEYESNIVLNVSAYGTTIQYLGMNNNLINLTMRKAISQAIDYDYLIDSLTLGHARRLKSPIPEGIAMADWTYNPLTYNVTAARLLMQNMSFGFTGGVPWNATYDPDAIDPATKKNYNLDHPKWRAASFKTYKYTYNIGNSFREDMLIYLFDALKDIGIKVINDGMTWGDFVHRLYEMELLDRDMLDLYFIGWIPDYNDPSNFINPLFTNKTVGSNGAQYDGFLAAKEAGRDQFALMDNVQLLMEAALAETDPATRQILYSRIQYLLVEEDIPWAFCYNPQPADAYDIRLHGIAPYADHMGRNHFYSMYFA